MYCTHDHGRVAGARLIYWAVLVVVCLAVGVAQGQEPRPGLLIEQMMLYGHSSDLVRGCPLRCDVSEPQQDYLAPLGMTITAGRRRAWEIDLSTGVKWLDHGPSEGGSEFTVRYYPRRGR